MKPSNLSSEAKWEALDKNYSMAGVVQLADKDVSWVARVLKNAGITYSIHGE